jgi:hypothetical protein
MTLYYAGLSRSKLSGNPTGTCAREAANFVVVNVSSGLHLACIKCLLLPPGCLKSESRFIFTSTLVSRSLGVCTVDNAHVG